MQPEYLIKGRAAGKRHLTTNGLTLCGRHPGDAWREHAEPPSCSRCLRAFRQHLAQDTKVVETEVPLFKVESAICEKCGPIWESEVHGSLPIYLPRKLLENRMCATCWRKTGMVCQVRFSVA